MARGRGEGGRKSLGNSFMLLEVNVRRAGTGCSCPWSQEEESGPEAAAPEPRAMMASLLGGGVGGVDSESPTEVVDG